MQVSVEISVVMSVYNAEKYLREAVVSVLNQSFTNFEFIIVNDGSSDSSLDILHSFSDKRMVIVNNESNKGLIYSLNLGIQLAKGKYLARMDADDICLPERFKIQYEFMEINPLIGVLGSSYYSFTTHSSKLHLAYSGSDRIKSFLLFSATFCHPSLFFRKSVILDNDCHFSAEAKHAEDYDLWTRLAFLTEFENLPIPLLKYRQHAGQVSKEFSSFQENISNRIRKNYLLRLGFVFTEEQLRIHQFISINKKITNRSELLDVQQWLLNLVQQNKQKNIFQHDLFNSAIGKMWQDCCGNTSLGLFAFSTFQNSDLKKYGEHHAFAHLKLMAKCIIRFLK